MLWQDVMSRLQKGPPPLPRRLLETILIPRQDNSGLRILEVRSPYALPEEVLHAHAVTLVRRDYSALLNAVTGDELLDFGNTPGDSSAPRTEDTPPRDFDLIVAGDLEAHRGNLTGSAALLATANLLMNLRAGGRLLLLTRLDPSWDDIPGGHLRSCYLRHLSAFAGKVEMAYFPDRLTDIRTWRWMLGRQPRSGYLVARLQIPAAPRSRSSWQSTALAAASRPQECCCLWARRQEATTSPPAVWRAA